MQTIYCIPGLGADENVFQNLDLSFAKPVFIKWIEPAPNDTLSTYALRLRKQFIDEDNPLILGLSLGGMLAVEIAKTMPSAKAIILSSAKISSEIPFYWKMFRYLPVHKFLPQVSIKNTAGIQQYFLSAHSPEIKKYLIAARTKADVRFCRWALDAIFNWNNLVAPSNIIHIHGTGDRLLPFRYVKADVSIKNAGHLMIMENAGEISEQIRRILHLTHSSVVEKAGKYK